MRKRITTSIDENILKELDIKIIQSNFFKDRSGYLEFLIQLSPFIPNDAKPDSDTKEIIRKMFDNTGESNIVSDPIQYSKDGIKEPDEADLVIAKMAKNFKIRLQPKESKTAATHDTKGPELVSAQ